MAAPRPVNSGHAQNHGGELAFGHRASSKTFSVSTRIFEVSAARPVHRTFFRDDRAVVLPINAGAAGINEFFRRRIREPRNEVAVAFQINFPVIVRAAAAGRGRSSRPSQNRAADFGERFRLRDVRVSGVMPAASIHFPPRAAAQAENFVALPDQFFAERQADVTAADNQNAHEEFNLRMRKIYRIYAKSANFFALNHQS
jgi:hypothetical protein